MDEDERIEQELMANNYITIDDSLDGNLQPTLFACLSCGTAGIFIESFGENCPVCLLIEQYPIVFPRKDATVIGVPATAEAEGEAKN